MEPEYDVRHSALPLRRGACLSRMPRLVRRQPGSVLYGRRAFRARYERDHHALVLVVRECRRGDVLPVARRSRYG
jgi:hypothetical protein